MIERGETWTEAHRHACEVRYVVGLPGRERRAAYLEGIAKRRGQAAADALRRDVMIVWRGGSLAPPPPAEGPRTAAADAVHPAVNGGGRAGGTPGLGSFLGSRNGGGSDPVTCVVSGGAAW